MRSEIFRLFPHFWPKSTAYFSRLLKITRSAFFSAYSRIIAFSRKLVHIFIKSRQKFPREGKTSRIAFHLFAEGGFVFHQNGWDVRPYFFWVFLGLEDGIQDMRFSAFLFFGRLVFKFICFAIRVVFGHFPKNFNLIIKNYWMLLYSK